MLVRLASGQIFKTLPSRTLKTFQFVKKTDAKFEIPPEYKNHKTFDRNAEFQNPLDQLVKPGFKWIIGGWLLLTAAGVYYMILLGGYTRLTHSGKANQIKLYIIKGLSMTRWRPIEYTYPRDQEQWEKEYEYYKQFPEYQHSPSQITLERFKKIYMVEYLHRISGSALGAIYVLPLTAFTAMKWVTPKYAKKLGAIGCLGLTQGLIGWWMVKSGVYQPKPNYQTKPRVSTYRLCVHLGLGVSLYSLLLWNAFTVLRKPQHLIINPENYKGALKLRGLGLGLIHLIAINILSGATMAGIDAGKVYNTWPLMNGAVVPDGLFRLSPIWTNFFENVSLVQFNHRLAAYATYSFSAFTAYTAYTIVAPRQIKLAAYLVFALVNYQLFNGILALLSQVPVHSGSIHQFNALNVLGATLFMLHCSRKPSSAYRTYLKQFI